ncbi:MAG: hypothetical protein ABIR34_00865 [Marmoricola sp.]
MSLEPEPEPPRAGVTRLLGRFRHGTTGTDPDVPSPKKSGAVRGLRVELALALAAQSRARIPEAINELDAALNERGERPTAAEIHCKVGELSEAQDPLTALRRYLFALEDHEMQDMVANRALALIDGQPEGELAALMLSGADLARLTKLARSTYAAPVSLLAARVLRVHADEESALEILQQAAATAQPADPGVLLQIALLLLDLHRLDELFELVADRVGDEQFRTVAMRAHLLRGDYERVNALATDGQSVRAPDVVALRALALAGEGSSADAEALLMGNRGAAIHAAGVVISLVGRKYDEAQAAATSFLMASPSDPSAMVLDAQVKLEALGEPSEAEEGAVILTAGEQFEARLGLLSAAVSRLSAPEGLWWLQVQNKMREGEGRYQFFSTLLRQGAGHLVRVDEFAAIDLSSTTYLQDAVVYERMAEAERRQGAPKDAAEAYGRASTAWQRDEVRDGQRSRRCAELAFELEPGGASAVDLAFAAIYDSYRPQDLQSLSATIDSTVEVALCWIPRTTGDQLAELTRGVAWLLGRRYELAVRDKVRLGTRAVPWLVAATFLAPHDSALSALLASALRSVSHPHAALYFAERAMQAERTVFTVSTTATCRLDHAEFDAVLDLVADPVLETETDWCQAVRLATQLISGRVEPLPAIAEQGFEQLDWVRGYAALGRCLQGGLASARGEIDAALDDVGEFEIDYLEVVLAAVSQRAQLHQELLDRAAASGNVTDRHLTMCQAVATWFADDDLEFESMAQAVLEAVPHRCDLEQFLNVDAPILVAARKGEDLVVPVAVPEGVLDLCRERLALEADSWRDRLDDLALGVGSLVAVVDATTTAQVAAEAERTLAPVSDPAFRHVVNQVVENATWAALNAVVRHQVEWLVGIGDQDADGVERSLEGEFAVPLSQQIAVLAVADGRKEDLIQRLGASTPDDLAEATGILVEAARTVVLDVTEFWRLHDSLDPELAIEGTQDFLRSVRNALMDVLTQLLDLGKDSPVPRSHFSFVLGEGFIPEDTGPDWTLFQDLVPAMKDRVEDETGFRMPGCFVRGDYVVGDALWLLTYGAVREAHRLPTRGWIVECEPGDALCRDPLTDVPVRVSDSEARPAGAWSPLEFALRWVERFALEHLPELVTVWDLTQLLEPDDPCWERLLTQPQPFVAALDIVRSSVRASVRENVVLEPERVAKSLRRLGLDRVVEPALSP